MTQKDDYVLGRGIVDSVRLDAQHLLWKLHRGFQLHPSIPLVENMKVAELGTGTAVWIFDLAGQLPPTAELHGFDISDSQFPAKELWPENVTLGVLNSLIDPPSSLVGQYDVVHLRMWASNLVESDLSTLARHVKHLLKPGGYIQWEEADLVHQRVKGAEAEKFEQNVNRIFKRVGLDYSWVSDLPTCLHDEKFNILESETGLFRPELVQLGTNTYLMALREILQGIKRKHAHDMLLSITEQELALYNLCSNNTGLIYNWSPVVVLAQSIGVDA